MANDRLYIRCSCGGPTAMLAKLFGEWAAWDRATENLDLFFEAHRGCSATEFSLASELEVVDLPSVNDRRCSKCDYLMKSNGARVWECLNPLCPVYQETDGLLEVPQVPKL